MELLHTRGEFVWLVYNPAREHVEVGENWMIIDRRERRGVLVQIIEMSVPDLPDILLQLIRREASEREVEIHRSEETSRRYLIVENMKYARGRIIREILKGEEIKFKRWSGYVPSRTVEFKKIDDEELIEYLRKESDET